MYCRNSHLCKLKSERKHYLKVGLLSSLHAHYSFLYRVEKSFQVMKLYKMHPELQRYIGDVN